MTATGTIGIAGAAGFIGSHLVEHFARVAFRVPDLVRADEFAGLDWLIHGAVQAYGPRHRDADAVNVETTGRMIGVARENSARIVFLSTLSAPDTTPIPAALGVWTSGLSESVERLLENA
jgi:nucleoside-diphosphate-sugar epimerase